MRARDLDPVVEGLRALPKKVGQPISPHRTARRIWDVLALHGTNPQQRRSTPGS
jgi:hypothetical protein